MATAETANVTAADVVDDRTVRAGEHFLSFISNEARRLVDDAIARHDVGSPSQRDRWLAQCLVDRMTDADAKIIANFAEADRALAARVAALENKVSELLSAVVVLQSQVAAAGRPPPRPARSATIRHADGSTSTVEIAADAPVDNAAVGDVLALPALDWAEPPG